MSNKHLVCKLLAALEGPYTPGDYVSIDPMLEHEEAVVLPISRLGADITLQAGGH